MSDLLTDDTKAIILLCGVFGKACSGKPLSQMEYTSLVHWLINSKMRPGDLLKKSHIADASMGTGIDRSRLESLLGRGVRLGFAVEEWQRNGIWVISRSDSDYPARYKKHLKDKAPPLLFGVGDRSLLVGGGLAIVGSRNVDKDGEEFTRRTAGICALNGMPVVSGGSRGVDQSAMTAALETGGITVGILPGNLLKRSLERNARHAIADGRLLLISPCHPNARFTVGTAMSRNRLIYVLADYGLIVSAEHRKGGTWAGAEQELMRDDSLPVFVRTGNNTPLGNGKLLDLGGMAWPESVHREALARQLTELAVDNRKKRSRKNMGLFDFQAMHEEREIRQEDLIEPVSNEQSVVKPQAAETVYQAVLPVMLNRLETPATLQELAESLDVVKTQLSRWLKKAVEENRIIKLSRPVRYQKAESGKQFRPLPKNTR